MRELGIEEYRDRVLNVLIQVDGICREHNINYMICYGTLLGAVRHGGFIPWDDDIDIVMLREDYERFNIVMKEYSGNGKLNYIDISNRKDTIYYCGKVCDSSTRIVESHFKEIEGYGAFVDVFPLDYLPNNLQKRKVYKELFLLLQRIVQHSSKIEAGKGVSWKQNLLLKIGFALTKSINTGKVISFMHSLCKKIMGKKTEYLGVPWGTAFPSRCFDKTVDIFFEGYSFKAPWLIEEVLRCSYGDYLTLPPESQRVLTHFLKCYER